jgi:hypothetical protein
MHLLPSSPRARARFFTRARTPAFAFSHVWDQVASDLLIRTASMAVMGEKLGMEPRISQLVCCGLGREPFFYGAVDPFNSVDDFMKGCHV